MTIVLAESVPITILEIWSLLKAWKFHGEAIEDIQFGKEKIKLSLYADHMILWGGNLKDHIHTKTVRTSSTKCVHTKPLQSCPTLCNPIDCSPVGSSVHGIPQARIPEWVALPSSRGSSWPRDRTHKAKYQHAKLTFTNNPHVWTLTTQNMKMKS